MKVDPIALEIAKLEEDQKTLQFVLKDAEWIMKNTPKEIVKVEKQIQELKRGAHQDQLRRECAKQ